MTDLSLIRNFSIIAHIDHGKSTLADRLLLRCGAVTEREFHDQMLDSMDIERERGITIKAQTVRLNYAAQDGKTYVLNLMDTPGHVDFAYEVSRSLAACEGSLLVVDASQGVEAQTLANAYHAIDANHEIIPVLNKIDLPSAEPERVCKEIEDVVGIDTSEAIKVSAKTGVGIDDLLEAMVKRLPPPKGDRNAPLKALLVDSWYDPYLGVVTLVRVQDGVLKKGMRIRMMAVGAAYDLDKVGIFSPKPTDVAELGPGEIGFIIAGIKTIADCKVGDTITDDRNTPITEYTVLAFPQDESLWRPQARQIMTTRPDQNGKYQLRGLPPGRYYLVAVDPAEQGEWFEPAYLSAHIACATSVSLADGDVKSQDFKLRVQ